LSLEVSELIALFFVLKELGSALIDRDRAICEKNELLEKCCHEVKDKAEAQKELSQACKDIQTIREERDVARKERTEAIIQRDQLLREYYQARQVTSTHLKTTHALYRYDKQPLLGRGQRLSKGDSSQPKVRHMIKSLEDPINCQPLDYVSCMTLKRI
jgi:hypothetical protein